MSRQVHKLKSQGPSMEYPESFRDCMTIHHIDSLSDMLAFARPHGSSIEEIFIQRYLDSVDGMMKDNKGNRYLIINEPGDVPPTIAFTAHTDTVHHVQGFQEIYLLEEGSKQSFCTDGRSVLGADDGTGVWLLLNMIEAGIPGMYLFFRGEECGGIGSSFMARETPEFVNGVTRIISFDRKGTQDIISKQWGGICCSQEFCIDFANQLNKTKGFEYKSDPTGSFTDSKNFTGIISECTNLSVGYYSQHTTHESQDIIHVQKLRDTLINIDWPAIGHYREPVKKSTVKTSDHSAFFTPRHEREPTMEELIEIEEEIQLEIRDPLDISAPTTGYSLIGLGQTFGDSIRNRLDNEAVNRLVYEYPHIAVEVLLANEINELEVADIIDQMGEDEDTLKEICRP